MPASVRITRHPQDGRRYRVGETVTLPDPVAAKLVAGGFAELTGRSASPQFSAMVACFGKRPSPPPAKVTVRMKAASRVAGTPRVAGDLVVVDESRAAMLVAEGLVDTPAGVSAQFRAKVAEFRKLDAFMARRLGGLQLATLI